MTKTLVPFVPYVSQEDVQAKAYANDCGPVVMKMLFNWARVALNIPADRISRDIGIAPRGKGSFSSMNQLIFVGSKYGLKLRHVRPALLPLIEDEIRAGRPVPTLLHYGSVPNRQAKFNGGHFVLVTGFDETTIYVHDPDWWGALRNRGEYFPILRTDFEIAYGPVGARKAGNLPYQCLFVVPQ